MPRLTYVAVVAAALCLSHGSRAAAPAFRFQDNFWVNLHHVLRGDARRRALGQPHHVAIDGLSPAERAAWSAAMEGYGDYARRDLVLDSGLVRINSALADTVGDAPFPDDLEPNAARMLTRAAAVYREHAWPADQRANDAWLAATIPLVQTHGYAVAAALEKIYQLEWPTAPIIVDACEEAGPVGGYTTTGPPGAAAHTVIAATDPQMQGDMALEAVFHEASHASAIELSIIRAIDAAARDEGIPVDRIAKDLWHTIIFYTTGVVVRKELGRQDDASYKPYAYRYGVYERGWQPLRDALEREWQPYLDGRTSYSAALRSLVKQTASNGGE